MLADTHVHLHPGFDLDDFFDRAAANIFRAAAALGAPGQAAGQRTAGVTDGGPSVEAGRTGDAGGARAALLLTEARGAEEFDRLRARSGATAGRSARGWEVVATEEEESVLVRRGGRELLVVAGRQIATRERLEVLALTTRRRFADGRPFEEVLSELRDRGVPAVVPWGFGKWWFERGRTVGRALEDGGRGLLLGDNRARPRGGATPAPMRRAAELGVAVVAGSDPLPLPGEERAVGSYGSVLGLRVDAGRPAASLRSHLLTLTDQPPTFGRRAGLLASLKTQALLRLRGARGGAR